MLNYSNMTPAEEFRINGKLSLETQEKLVDLSEQPDMGQKYKEWIGELRESKAGMPDEDFACEPMRLLENLRYNLRKSDIKEALGVVIEKFNAVLSEQNRQTEYGLEKLDSVIQAIKNDLST